MTPKSAYCLARAYIDARSDASALLPAFDLLEAATRGRAIRVEVNYGRQESLVGARKRLVNLSGGAVEQMLAFNDNGDLAFAVLKEPLEGLGCYSLLVTWERADELKAAADLLVQLSSVAHVAYGYARTAPANMSPLTEAPIRKRWFGASTIVPKRREGWISPSKAVLDGGVRGLYPVNVWRSEAHAELHAQGIRLPSELDGATGLVRIDAACREVIRSINDGNLPWMQA